jgi:outer membrane protein TolC
MLMSWQTSWHMGWYHFPLPGAVRTRLAPGLPCLIILGWLMCTATVHAQPATPPRPPADGTDDGTSAEAAQARPARGMTLRAVLDAVVQQNPDLSRSAADVATAEADVLSAMGVDDWMLAVTGSWVSNRSEFSQPYQPLAIDSFSTSAELSRGLSTGGTVKIDVDGSYSDSTFVVGTVDNPITARFAVWSSSLIASINQPLLGGRGKRVARAEQRRTRVARDAASLQREISALDTIREVVRMYWELAYASRAVDIQRGSLELAREQLRITEAAVRMRVSSPSEILAVRHAIAVREQTVMLAEVQVSELSLTLRRLAGLEIGPGEIDIAATDAFVAQPATGPATGPGARPTTGPGAQPAAGPGAQPATGQPAPDAPAIDLDAAIERARTSNPRLALARTGTSTADIAEELAEDALRPRLDFTAQLGPTGNATDAGDTLRQIGTFQAYTAGASLTYTSSFGQRLARGGRDRAREVTQRARIDLAEAERELAVSVVRAVDLVRVARKRIDVSVLAVELAEQNLASERTLFEAGEARNFDILARQDELAQALLSRERAIADYHQAAADLEALTGDLLPHYGVELVEP